MGLRLRLLVLLIALLPAESRSDESSERAIRALRRDSSLKVRTQAALVLGQRGGADAVQALCEALSRDEVAVVRMAAASALGRIGDPAARDALERARAGDPEVPVRGVAARALADIDTRLRGAAARSRVLTIEEVQGKAGDASAREVLRASLARSLAQRGFSVVGPGEGAAYRIKPAVLSLDVTEKGGKTLIAVRASAMAVDGTGRMAAMIEGSARLKADVSLSHAAQAQLSARAIDAAANSLSEDLAAKLQ